MVASKHPHISNIIDIEQENIFDLYASPSLTSEGHMHMLQLAISPLLLCYRAVGNQGFQSKM